MRISGLPLAGLIVLTTLGLTLAGCTGADDTTAKAPASSPTPTDPRQVLAGSTKGLAAGNFSFTVTGHEQQGEGTADRASNSARAALALGAKDFTMNRELRYVAPDMWTKMVMKTPEMPAGDARSNKWQHIDPALAKDIPNLQFNWETSDLLGGQGVIKAVVTAERAADGSFSGTTDVSTLKGSTLIDADLIAELGDRAKTLPFKATLDDQGRLATLTLKMPQTADIPPHDLTVSYSAYGTAPATARPAAAEAEEAGEETYEMFE